MSDDVRPPELLPLRRMAARVGVTGKWLKEQAEAGKIPGLCAGNRWLFAPDVVREAMRAMAGDLIAQPVTPERTEGES